MDPLGFAFESFDELGKWRSGNDSTVLKVDGSDTPVQGAAELMAAVVRRPELSRCLVSQWLAWALKRVPRSSAARALVVQELDALRQRLPNDVSVQSHKDTLLALPAP